MKLDINFKNVSLKYNDFEALKNISFSLSPDKIYGLIGRNGAGKTSLLSLIASLNYPTSGTIRINGEDPFEHPVIMPQVSFIYETDYSDEYETAKEYFEYAERYRPNFNKNYARELIDLFNLPIDKSIRDFSKGMQSAFNATLGLASGSPISIFDEVYLGMDAPTREIFYKELLKEQEQHPGIKILSTHLVSEMDYLFDHVLILDQGELIISESFDEIVSRGASITGKASEVDKFVKNMNILSSKQLAGTKSVMVYNQISEEDKIEADKIGLEIGSVALQDIFIYLTEKRDSNE